MQRRYICFTCYQYHPEMKGVSEEEFIAGNNVCREEKCVHKGELLEAAIFCEVCQKMYRESENHKHDQE